MPNFNSENPNNAVHIENHLFDFDHSGSKLNISYDGNKLKISCDDVFEKHVYDKTFTVDDIEGFFSYYDLVVFKTKNAIIIASDCKCRKLKLLETSVFDPKTLTITNGSKSVSVEAFHAGSWAFSRLSDFFSNESNRSLCF